MKLLEVLLVLLQLKVVMTDEPFYTHDDMTCYHRVVQSHENLRRDELIPYAMRILSMQVADNGHYSQKSCVLDGTYGFYRNYVWVSNGCGANFRVCYIRGRNILVVCKSEGEGLHWCHMHRTIIYMKLIKSLDVSTCNEGETFGFKGEHIWVSKGCKAAFRITTPIGDNAPPYAYL